MASLYAQYIKEREDKECIETEHSFASYQIWEDSIYIEDVYVSPNLRRQGYAAQMVDEITRIAKSLDKKFLYSSVSPAANGATQSLKVVLACGFKLHNSSPDLIMFVKEL